MQNLLGKLKDNLRHGSDQLMAAEVERNRKSLAMFTFALIFFVNNLILSLPVFVFFYLTFHQ